MNVSKNADLVRAWRKELQNWCDAHGVSVENDDDTILEDEATIELPLDAAFVASLGALLDGLRVEGCQVAGESGPYDEPCHFWAKLSGPCGTVVLGFGEQLDWYLDELASWIPDDAYLKLSSAAHRDRIHDDRTHERLIEMAGQIFGKALAHAPAEVRAIIPFAAEQAAGVVEESLSSLHLAAYADHPDEMARMLLRDFPSLAGGGKEERRDLVFMALRAMDTECVDSYAVVQPVIDEIDARCSESAT